MIILGLDPAINNTGWGVIKIVGSSLSYVASGVISNDIKDKLEHRLAYIAQEIDKIVNIYNPNMVSIEEIFVNMNPASSIKLAHARGVIMSIIGKYELPLYEFAPNRIKKTLVGAGKADKSQIIYMINKLMPNAQISKTDEADALAIAYTCFAFYGNNAYNQMIK